MSVHKLTAGSGYDYLTRQVAALDATEKGHTGLASYYTERGEAPGQWVGSGLAGIEGLTAGDAVTAQQMHALFGSGHHPLAAQRLAALEDAHRDGRRGPSARDREAVTRLGAPFNVYAGDVSPFRLEVARRIAAVNTDAGLPRDSPVPADDRARMRTEVAREFFLAEHGRPPRDARELAAEIARRSRPRTTAVAGYDLTFSPVKSVSALWAIAPPDIAARIERAHQGAVGDALRFIETHALYTRTGRNGVRQVDVTGLVGTAFTHRDSRAGDPDLHTHVAIANKVQTHPTNTDGTDSPSGGVGRWLSIDGRVLFKAVVAASETYNTALETRLRDDLGLQFAAREEQTRSEDRKRPVREIVGLPAVLLRAWSVRRADIEVRRGELAARFQRDHARPPIPVETLHLAQQANLETRAAKHEPRTLAEQRATWQAQAEDVLGGPQPVRQMLRDVLVPDRRVPPQQELLTHVGGAWLDVAAARAVAALQARRSTWQVWHVRAEAQRQVRNTASTRLASEQAVDALVDEVLRRHSVALTAVERDARGREVREPLQLRRGDGSSVYRVAGADLFTSTAVLAAEQRLVAVAGRRDGRVVDGQAVEKALLEATANGTELNAGQVALVREMTTSGARLQLAIAPAGTGKTTAMAALAAAWTNGGGTVIGLAPSAAAAAALRDHIGTRNSTVSDDDARRGDEAGGAGGRVQTETLAKLTWSLTHGELPAWAAQIDATTLVLIDEAGMADTLSLDAAVTFIVTRGGSVRLVGDDQQLAAIGAGGVLRDIQASHGAVHLSELLRFHDPAEGAVTLALREGRPEALGFYLDHDRVHVGDLTTLTEEVFGAWLVDRSAGLDSIMLAPTHDLVSDLNQRARAHRLAAMTDRSPATDSPRGSSGGDEHGGVVRLTDGNEASVGDLLITRTNDRSLRTSSTDWVKNGDRWTLTQVHDDGAVTARHVGNGRAVRLPASYVQASTELGYATTVHSAQGVSVDTMHGLASGQQAGPGPGGLSRQQLYTMLTRGRLANHVYLEVVGDGDAHSVIRPELIHPLTATDHLEAILARDDTPTSATTSQREQSEAAVQLGDATARYVDALHVAAEDHLGPDAVAGMETEADSLVSGLTGKDAAQTMLAKTVLSESPAWPALRAHLLLLGAAGTDPLQALQAAAAAGGLDEARDVAAVLDWRLDYTGLRDAGRGPLPWLPAVPAALREDPTWGEYLSTRADLVHDLAHQVHHRTVTHAPDDVPTNVPADVPPAVPPTMENHSRPSWLEWGTTRSSQAVVAEVQVWRAAMQVEASDRRPTGGRQLQKAASTWQRTLDKRLLGDRSAALAEWGHLLERLSPALRTDLFSAVLAERLAALSRAGVDAATLLQTAVGDGVLPDDHAAAALWWRVSRHVSPAVATQLGQAPTLPASWTGQLQRILREDRAAAVMASTFWPALISVVDHGAKRGWAPEALLTAAAPHPPDTPTDADRDGRATLADSSPDGDEECLAMVWRASILTDPAPPDGDHDDVGDPPPPDLWDDAPDASPLLFVEPDPTPPTDAPRDPQHPQPDQHPHEESQTSAARTPGPEEAGTPVHPPGQKEPAGDPFILLDPHEEVLADLAVQARLRGVLAGPEPSHIETERTLQRAFDIETSPVTPERVSDINQLALAYFQHAFPGSWAQAYLEDRFALDLTGHPTVRPGYAPGGWTGLVRHLHRAGVSKEEMLTAGVATTASTGRLIDRFRDGAVLPVIHDNRVLAFVARRHPDLTDSHEKGPKYLNTATTIAYSKSAQLYVPDPRPLTKGAVPVLVEGPMDAIAVTLATGGSHVGVTPLGTSLSDQQAAQLARLGVDPVVATDADLAGRVAAERAYWTLTLHRMDPTLAALPPGSDPADLHSADMHGTNGASRLRQVLQEARPLGDALVQERLAHLPTGRAVDDALRIVAARPPEHWATAAHTLSQRSGHPRPEVDRQLLAHARAFNADPRHFAETALHDLRSVREHLQASTAVGLTSTARVPAQRWRSVALAIDPRLVLQGDWPALADLFDRLDREHHDVAATARHLIHDAPLGAEPAQDLRYRLLNHLRLEPQADDTSPSRRAPTSVRNDLLPKSAVPGSPVPR